MNVEERPSRQDEEDYGEPCDCGGPRTPEGFYITHAVNEHPDCEADAPCQCEQ